MRIRELLSLSIAAGAPATRHPSHTRYRGDVVLASQRIGPPAICLVVTLMRFHTLMFAIARTSAAKMAGS